MSLTGHAIGMTCCILIWLYISDELSYNKNNKNLERIYRINWITRQDGKSTIEATVPIPLAPDFSNKVTGVEAIGRMYLRSGEMQAANTGANNQDATLQRFQEKDVFFADESILKIFSIGFINGNPTGALDKPGKIILTDEMALKYFGTTNAIGKTITYENKLPLQVTGVVKKMPKNSDIRFDFLIAFESLYTVEHKDIADFLRRDWTYNASFTYLLFRTPPDVHATNILLNQLLKDDGTNRNKQLNSLAIQPLKDIHLYAANVNGNQSTGSITYIYMFSAIALLILLIANINFINLSVARAIKRTMEIGMRKILGADKKQLVMQVVVENIFINFAALIIAVCLSIVTLPILNQLTRKQLEWTSLFTISNAVIIILFFTGISIIAGLYPGFLLSSFKPVEALKGKSGDTNKKHLIRKMLLTFQFIVSIMLIIGAVMVYRQINYLHNKPLGFKKHEVVVVPIFGSGDNDISYGVDGPMRQRMNLFEDKLSRYNRIKGVTIAAAMPGNGFIRGLVIPEGFSETDNIFVPWVSVDYNFLDVLQMPLVAGRTFSKARGTDYLNAFILNESAVRSFGWKSPEAALGKNITRGEAATGKKGQVIGVIKDFDFNSLDRPMEPMILDVNAPRFTRFAISIAPDHANETIGLIKQTWNEIFPERVFEYNFLDKQIDSLYKDQDNLSYVISYFSVIAILLSCSGLFSLASFLSSQRTREIAIRKTLGANISSILVLLSWDFVKIVLIAFAIAAPLALWGLYGWLSDFAYHVDIAWWIFLATLLAVSLIAFATVSLQSVKVALLNPVKSLRSE